MDSFDIRKLRTCPMRIHPRAAHALRIAGGHGCAKSIFLVPQASGVLPHVEEKGITVPLKPLRLAAAGRKADSGWLIVPVAPWTSRFAWVVDTRNRLSAHRRRRRNRVIMASLFSDRITPC